MTTYHIEASGEVHAIVRKVHPVVSPTIEFRGSQASCYHWRDAYLRYLETRRDLAMDPLSMGSFITLRKDA